MGERRMISKKITDTDSFLSLSATTQLLYFHLLQRGDDDGFISNPKTIMRMIGSSEQDMLSLIQNKFIIAFDNGVVVIKHWRIHNYIRNDRYTPTTWLEEKEKLTIDENGSYTECIQSGSDLDTSGRQLVYQRDTQVKLSKVKLSKDKLSKNTKHIFGEYKNVRLTDEELEKLKADYPNYQDLITFLDEYIEMKGYKAKSHYLAIKKWVVDAVKERTRNSDVLPKYEEEKISEGAIIDW